MDAELMKSRIEKAIARYERNQMKVRKKNKVWSKINRSGQRIPLRKPYTNEFLKTLREAG